MHDLSLLRDSGGFRLSNSAPTKLAMFQQSFRTTSVRRGAERQTFGAHFPALGLLNLAHSLRSDATQGKVSLPEIKYFDEAAYSSEHELASAMLSWFSDSPRRIIAASAYTVTIDYLEAFLSRFDPYSHLIITGGAHATLAPDIANTHIVVRGEGGAAMRHILSCLFTEEFGKGADSAGVCYVLDGEKTLQKQAFDRSLEILSSPAFAYDLLPHDATGNIYATSFTRMLGHKPQIYICTQSCRARCTFCSTYLIHGKTKARPIHLIRDDLDHLVKTLNYDCIEFHDDDLLQHPDFIELLDVMYSLNVPWFCYGRVDTITDDIADRMAAAGCKRVFLGIESMDQEALDYYNKKTSVEANHAAVEALARAGIGVVAGFIVGGPSDTVDSVLKNLDAFLSLPLLAINCSVLSPDPGTAEFNRARRKGGEFLTVIGGENGNRLIPQPERFGIEAPMGLPTVCENISKADLGQLVNLIDAEFYLREQIWLGLTNGLSVDQITVVRDWYSFVYERLHSNRYTGKYGPIADRLVLLEQRIQQEHWLKRVLEDDTYISAQESDFFVDRITGTTGN